MPTTDRGVRSPSVGWSLNDLKTPLNGAVRHFDVRAPGRVARSDPFAELDDRPGYYLRGEVAVFSLGAMSALFLDNRGDSDRQAVINDLWSTRFYAVTGETTLPGEITFVPHVMFGETAKHTTRWRGLIF